MIANRREDLRQACRELWRATLSLMRAYRLVQGPARRVMLARRIARNVQTLQGESAFFAPASREAIARLARHWAHRAGWR